VRRAAALLLALAAAGCVTREGTGHGARSTEPGAEAGGGPSSGALVIECDRARVVVPAGAEGLRREGRREIRWEGTLVRTREADLDLECAGSDFTVVAEGIVRLVRREGARTVEEGPYGTVIIRNGSILRR
jgi:hypothetical protein